MLLKSLLFAMEKHSGQTRIGGSPYITHPISVASILEEKGFKNHNYIVTAFFHDLLEDTNASENDILYYGGTHVLEAVKLLTKYPGYNMDDYIFSLSQNTIAKVVKLADRLHNLLSALDCNVKFKLRYIKETEDYYLDLSKGTVFENDIEIALLNLKNSLN